MLGKSFSKAEKTIFRPFGFNVSNPGERLSRICIGMVLLSNAYKERSLLKKYRYPGAAMQLVHRGNRATQTALAH